MKILKVLGAAAALAVFASSAFAQNATLGQMPNAINQTSVPQTCVVGISPLGVGTVPTGFIPCGLLGSMDFYSYQVPVTAFTITPAQGVTLLFLNPAGTLATGTLNLPANPSPGMTFCLYDTQTQTAITVAANTGQTLVGTAVTALVADTKYCWQYISQTTSWYRTL